VITETLDPLCDLSNTDNHTHVSKNEMGRECIMRVDVINVYGILVENHDGEIGLLSWEVNSKMILQERVD
jgi:hypothetical protein